MATIEMDARTKRFYQGAAAATKVVEAHAEVDFPDHEVRVAMFWFYVGALAGGEYGCTESEDFEPFVLGANTRAPRKETEESPWLT